MRGTVISLVNPLEGQGAVFEPTTAAINRPITDDSGPPAITADFLSAAISAVLVLGAVVVAAMAQLEASESGFWFSFPFPK